MALVEINQPAPEFQINDIDGVIQSLSKYKGKKHIVLVLNRGFM